MAQLIVMNAAPKTTTINNWLLLIIVFISGCCCFTPLTGPTISVSDSETGAMIAEADVKISYPSFDHHYSTSLWGSVYISHVMGVDGYLTYITVSKDGYEPIVVRNASNWGTTNVMLKKLRIPQSEVESDQKK